MNLVQCLIAELQQHSLTKVIKFLLLGYSRHEVLGHNCRFLNGPRTDVEVLDQVGAK